MKNDLSACKMIAYQMTYSEIGCPMTDALLCRTCSNRTKSSAKRIYMHNVSGFIRYCDNCKAWLGVEDKERNMSGR